MVIALIVFIIVAWFMFMIFGAPECDSLANRTATSLKFAIDEVAEKVPEWREGVPDDITYYRTADITLCQTKGISTLEIILGATMEPQYRIYYEQFPEGGGGIWTEAYPWSGGAASTLRMWGYMRIGTGIFSISAKYLSTVGMVTNFMKKLKGVGSKVMGWFSDTDIDDVVKMAQEAEEVGAMPGTRPAEWWIEGSKAGEAAKTIEECVGGGVCADGISGSRIVVSKTPVKLEIPVQMVDTDGKLKTFFVDVYVKKVSDNIVDMSTDIAKASDPAWELLQVSPADMYRDWLETLPSDLRKVYQDIFVPEDEIGVIGSLKGKIRQSDFYKKFYKPIEDRLKKFVLEIKTAGYRTDITEMTTQEINGIKLGTIKALDDPDVADMFLKQDGIRDKIARALGKSADDIQASHLKEFLDKFKLNGIVFIPSGTDLEVSSSAIKSISDAVGNGITYTNYPALFRDALGYDLATDAITDPDRYKIIEDIAKTIEKTLGAPSDVAKDLAFDRAEVWVNVIFLDYAKGITDKTTLTSNFINGYLTGLVTSYNLGDEMSAVQIANFLGFIEQNKGVLPTKIRTPAAMAVDYFKAQGKKMIYLDGPQNILNPTSFYARAIFASLTTTGCQGNSVCVYSHASMLESPVYLSPTADNYFVRSWRPVSPVAQWAGWQAALQHIPPHPRFYVVSPCFAKAKVWKTNLDGEPTIFVLPEKVDMNGTASNYCYADEGLVNTYTAIWAASDVATIITTLTGVGTVQKALKLPQEAMKLVGQVINIADPVTLAQGIAEGFVSWPGWPFQPLNYTQMIGAAGAKTIKTFTENK